MSAGLPIRGLIEGFYGTPWTHAQRLDMIDFVAETGMNTFVYAPKDDPLLRRDWREPYVGAGLDALAGLIARCRSRGVGFVFALSPGLSMRYSDPGDVEALVTKYRQVRELGADGIALLLDDIPPRLQHPGDIEAFPSLVAAQVELVGRVRADLPSVPLMVAPTQYWGRGDEPQIAEFGRGLDPSVDVLWTGRAICSPELEAADARRFLEATGHAPLYWDNFPVNDVAMTGELHIGPYLGRDPGLHEVSRGIIANAMPLAEASKIGLASVAEFANDPAGFDAEAAWERAVARVAGDDHETVREFADAFRGSALCADDSPRLADALARFAFEYDFGDRAAALAGLTDEAARLSAVAERMQGIANRELAREAAPWIAQYARAAEGLALCAEALASTPVTDVDRERVMAHLRELRSQRLRAHGDLVDMFLSDTAREFEGPGAG